MVGPPHHAYYLFGNFAYGAPLGPFEDESNVGDRYLNQHSTVSTITVTFPPPPSIRNPGAESRCNLRPSARLSPLPAL